MKPGVKPASYMLSKMKKSTDGYLLIDKPLGWTSFDVVNKVRFTLADELGVKPKSLKVGHAGTLDPLASGLLIILVGSYTKRQPEFMGLDKTYEAEIRLGQTSETDDGEGVKQQVSTYRPKPGEVKETLKGFEGRIEQIPPLFSAVKIKGKPAYARARAGQSVELKPKPVTINSFKNIDYNYPSLRFTVEVSSGTYIRSLARDIGRKLGTGAYLKYLKRTRIGRYRLEEAADIKGLDKKSVQVLLSS